jgi:hypothetical protein
VQAQRKARKLFGKCRKTQSMSLLGVKRTCLFAMQMSAFDPKRTPRSYSVSSIGLVGSVVPSLKQNRLGLLLMNLRDGFSVPS